MNRTTVESLVALGSIQATILVLKEHDSMDSVKCPGDLHNLSNEAPQYCRHVVVLSLVDSFVAPKF